MAKRVEADDAPEGAFLTGVARALEVLDRLSLGEGETLSDLARHLGVNKNIAFRLVFTLESLGYIFEEPSSKKLRLTYKLANIVRTQWLASDVLSQAEPVLKALALQSGELVRLAVVTGHRLEWVFAETGSRRLLRIDPAYPGNIIPHVHATSKAHLMTLDDAALADEIAKMSFEAYSPNTIRNAPALRANLAEARAEGFALSYDERDLGVAAVAAPVMAGRAPAKVCVAVVSLSVPSSRVTRAQLQDVARSHVVPAAQKLSSFWPIPSGE